MLKIYSWNVNGVRSASRKGFLDWLHRESPDILCLQEIKCMPGDLDESVLTPAGYQSFWHPAEKKGYSGVAMYTKREPIEVQIGMNSHQFDSEGRTMIAEFGKFILINCYFPNSRRDHSRLDYKLDYCAAILKMCNAYVKKGMHIALCGDINIAHKEIDLRNPKTNMKNAGFLPEERSWFDKYLDAGYIDSFREFVTEPGHYTWWSNRPGVREKNIGWRLDYFFVNKAFRPKLKAAKILPHVYGSDHCPVSIELDV